MLNNSADEDVWESVLVILARSARAILTKPADFRLVDPDIY